MNKRDQHESRHTPEEHFEPYEMNNPIPWPIIALALTLAAWGLFTFIDSSTAIKENEQQLVQSRTADASEADAKVADSSADGPALFADYCVSCHQTDGAGISGTIPPLRGSPWVLGNPEITAAILLQGIDGPIDVHGFTYSGRMPTFGDSLNNQEIAAIVSHIRASWNNNSDPLSADRVQALRERLSQRETPWRSGDELARSFNSATMEETQ